MKKITYLFVLVMLISGCSSVYWQLTSQRLTPLQRRVLESKELEGKFDDAFKATISVLQDKGYMIKTSDYGIGLIYAESAPHLLPGQLGYTEAYSITINFEKFTEDRVKMRLSIFRQLYTPYGKKDGMTPFKPFILTGMVDEPQMYQDFYNEILKEMFIRKNLNK